MVICNIITTLVFGGAERLLVNYTNALSEAHELHVIYLKGEPKLKDSFNPKIKIHYIPMDWNCIRKIRKLVTHIKADIVHTHLGHADLIGMWACRRLPVKLFCTMHNVYFKWNWIDNIIFNLYFISFKLYARTCKVSCISNAVALHVQKRLGVPESNIVVIKNCIPDLKILENRHELREQLSMIDSDFCLLLIGRLKIQKSIDTLLLAIPALRNKIHNLKVIIVGEGEMEKSLKDLSREIGINDLVEFRGSTLHPEKYLASADTFILPSVFEGLPTVILEAFRASLPVIASDIDGTNELIVNEKNGLLFPAKDTDKLVEQVLRIYQYPLLRNKLGHEGHLLFKEKYTIDNYVKQTLALYRA